MYEKAALRTIFQKQYDPQVWKNMMRDFFDAEIRTTPQQLDLPGCDDMGFYLGDKELQNGLKLGFFHFQINSGNVLRKRVGLRNLVNPFLKYDVDAAIVVFSDLKHWRLSFISDFGKDATAPKRFTYVFGDSTQFYNTPANRLYDLQGKELSLGVLYDTFSVESLSDEFFTEYKKLYLELCDFVNEHRTDTDYFGAEFASWEEKHIRDYVKKLMGRLVFLQFVQKKGWLGDNSNYLRKLFKNSAPQKQDNFLDQVLEPLFFGVFNTQPQSRQENFLNNGWDLSLLEQWKSVPFLSGGLFEMDKHDVPTSRFPKEYFEELFDFFAQYNFTIDENDPNDAEVGVDPEMLGKIFENLLEDNKDKGAYYTPKEIVHYMSCESVIQYLKSHTDESLHADIERLVNCNELGDTIREMKNAKQIGQLLKAVKVCDPAIGSGAFPMGVLNVIFNCRRTMLEELTAERFDDYVRIKKDIIQNNIYGVDIEQGAVDIARLRFWLALLVDAKEPEALPNLNYKIMRGNSLIPTFDGQYIDLEVKGEYDAGKQRCLQELLGLQSSFYTLVSDEKCKAEIRIKQLILDIVAMQIGKELRAWDEQHAVQGNIFEPRNMEDLKKILPEEKLNVLRKGQRIRDRLNDESVSLQERASTDLDFFDWHIMFSDVFENNGGFDIVIGNPPYVNVANIKDQEYRNILKGIYQCTRNKTDLYAYFIEKALLLANPFGIVAYIIPETWKATDSFCILRKILFENSTITRIVNLKMGVFDAVVRPLIIIIDNHISNKPIQVFDGLKKYKYDIFRSEVENSPTFAIDTESSIKEKELFEKIESVHRRLGEVISFSRGIKTSNDKRFIKNTLQNNDCKKVFRGRNIKAYSLNWNGEYVWYRPDLMKEKIGSLPHSKEFFEAPEKLITQRVNSSMQLLVAYDNEQNYFLDTTNVSRYDSWDKSINLMCICGILNSKLINVWYSKKYRMPTIGGYELESIPIPQLSEVEQNKITAIVSEILILKKEDPQFDTSIMENEIDRLVYELYGLTEEEIAIVEEATR